MTLPADQPAEAPAPTVSTRAADDAQTEYAMMLAARADVRQFAPLYERYFTRIYKYCLRRVETPQEAEDLTSQVFVRAMRALDSYRGGMVAAWLFRIAHNVVVNHLRSRRPQVSLDDMGIELMSDSAEPIKFVIRAEQEALVRDLVATLSDYQQDLLALKLSGEMTSEEIGVVVGKSAGAVRVDLHRTISQLRTMFQQMTGERDNN
jgi:RNA polymerase sigma-70 factor (ECF subfamily)